MSLHKAAWDMLHAVEAADADGELADNIGGELIDALRAELDKPPEAQAVAGEPDRNDPLERAALEAVALWIDSEAEEDGFEAAMHTLADRLSDRARLRMQALTRLDSKEQTDAVAIALFPTDAPGHSGQWVDNEGTFYALVTKGNQTYYLRTLG